MFYCYVKLLNDEYVQCNQIVFISRVLPRLFICLNFYSDLSVVLVECKLQSFNHFVATRQGLRMCMQFFFFFFFLHLLFVLR